MSCDAYSDLWKPFFNLYFKFWPDNIFNTFLLSNFKKYKNNRIRNISIGKDRTWSLNLISALKKLDNYEYLLLLMEDTFLKKKVDTKHLNKIIKKFISHEGNFLTLINEPKPDKTFNKYYGKVSVGAAYRPTITFAVWKRKTLLSLLSSDENAWDFEKKGALRSDQFDQFYSVNSDQFHYIHGVIKGKWLFSAIKDLKILGIDINLKRGVYKNKFQIFFIIYKIIRKIIFIFTPFKYRRRLTTLWTTNVKK